MNFRLAAIKTEPTLVEHSRLTQNYYSRLRRRAMGKQYSLFLPLTRTNMTQWSFFEELCKIKLF
jgi:hypothetical protein